MFQSPHATSFCRLSTVQWWNHSFIRDHISIVRRLWWILLGWMIFKSVNLVRYYCKYFFELFYEFCHFLIRFLLVGFRLFLVGLNLWFHDDEMFTYLFSVLFIPFGALNIEVWQEVSYKYINGYNLVISGTDRN